MILKGLVLGGVSVQLNTWKYSHMSQQVQRLEELALQGFVNSDILTGALSEMSNKSKR